MAHSSDILLHNGRVIKAEDVQSFEPDGDGLFIRCETGLTYVKRGQIADLYYSKQRISKPENGNSLCPKSSELEKLSDIPHDKREDLYERI